MGLTVSSFHHAPGNFKLPSFPPLVNCLDFQPLLVTPLTTSAMLLADRGEVFPTKAISIPTAAIAASLSDQDKQNAVAIVRKSGVVETINKDQDWEPDRIYRIKLAGTEGVKLDAIWEGPVESSGPWSLIHCQGTRKSSTSERWSKVTRLVVFVDMKEESVAGFGVTSQKEDAVQPVQELAEAGEPIKLYDVKTGEILFEGSSSDVPTKQESCPEGTYKRD